jgi:subtilase family serine protease
LPLLESLEHRLVLSGKAVSASLATGGAIVGSAPVSSPFESSGPQSTAGPAGFIPLQIQTAYGLSTGTAFNNNIAFGGIKGNGAGQTIGIYEEGYNPAFVDTSASNYGSSALAVFDKAFGLPDPPSLTFFDHNGVPLSSTSDSSNNSDFANYGNGLEIALDIEWAHAMAPGANIDVVCGTPQPSNTYALPAARVRVAEPTSRPRLLFGTVLRSSATGARAASEVRAAPAKGAPFM